MRHITKMLEMPRSPRCAARRRRHPRRRPPPPPPPCSKTSEKEETGGGRGAGAASTAPHRRAALAVFVDCDSGDYFVFAHGATTDAPRGASADTNGGMAVVTSGRRVAHRRAIVSSVVGGVGHGDTGGRRRF